VVVRVIEVPVLIEKGFSFFSLFLLEFLISVYSRPWRTSRAKNKRWHGLRVPTSSKIWLCCPTADGRQLEDIALFSVIFFFFLCSSFTVFLSFFSFFFLFLFLFLFHFLFLFLFLFLLFFFLLLFLLLSFLFFSFLFFLLFSFLLQKLKSWKTDHPLCPAFRVKDVLK